MTIPCPAPLDEILQGGMHALRDTLKCSGGPLVELLDDGRARVVFVWIAGEETNDVTLVHHLSAQGPYGEPMKRIPDFPVFFFEAIVPWDVITSYQFAPGWPAGSMDEFLAMPDGVRAEYLGRRFAHLRRDPFNPDAIMPTSVPPGPLVARDSYASVLALPGAPPFPAAATRVPEPGQPVRFRSEILGNERDITIEVAGPVENANVVILLDGPVWTWVVPASSIVRELVERGALQPTVTVTVDHASATSRDTEYRCSPAFADALADELLPLVASTLGTEIADRARIAIVGLARGGLAACHAAIERSDRFGSAVSLSGSLWWAPPGDSELEWLARRCATAPTYRSTSFFLSVGRFEDAASPVRQGLSMMVATRHFRDVVTARGMRCRYVEVSAGHEAAPHRVTLPEALQWLFSDRVRLA